LEDINALFVHNIPINKFEMSLFFNFLLLIDELAKRVFLMEYRNVIFSAQPKYVTPFSIEIL